MFGRKRPPPPELEAVVDDDDDANYHHFGMIGRGSQIFVNIRDLEAYFLREAVAWDANSKKPFASDDALQDAIARGIARGRSNAFRELADLMAQWRKRR